MKAEILKTHCDAETATLSLPSHSEHCITVQASETREMSHSLRDAAARFNATILSQFVFAGSHHYDEFSREMGQTDWPVVWLQGDACKDGDLYSMQAVALSGLTPQPIHLNGRDMGFTYEDETARYCRLRGVIPQDLSASRAEQTRSAFETMDAALKLNGFRFTDTVRTWIYLDRLLDWYDDFNIVRTQYFNETGIFDHMVPASTGIGAGNQYGAAIMMDVLAVQPKDNRLKIQEVISPLQNPALDYKSSFARAVEMAYPTHKNLLISGTASIDPAGKTVHLDDPEKQIRLTMDVVNAILESRGMGWGDLFRGIAYFKDMAYQPVYEKIAAELGIPRFPLAISHADVCRHDLLFEIEVDAVKIA
ncbi:MAG: translation initiation inhibitor [Verrucomicrobia bacterium]|nr:translation initiation inhibitor [Verrucomicrobiota bacterium]